MIHHTTDLPNGKEKSKILGLTAEDSATRKEERKK